MKKISFWAVLCLCIALVACSDDESVANVPQLTSEIQLDRERIGVNQEIKVTVQVPSTLSTDVASVEYAYLDATGLTYPVTPDAESRCNITYTFSSAGEKTITFQATYVFNIPDANGEIYRIDKISKNVTAITCDVRNSFWGDSLEETIRNAGTNLTLNGNYTEPVTLSSTFGSGITVGGDGSKAVVSYKFDASGKLSSVSETTTFSTSGSMTAYMISYYRQMVNAFGDDLINQRIWLSSESEKYDAYFTTYLDTEKPSAEREEAKAALDEFFRTQEGGVGFSFEKGTTQLGVSFGGEADGTFDVSLNYDSKN